MNRTSPHVSAVSSIPRHRLSLIMLANLCLLLFTTTGSAHATPVPGSAGSESAGSGSAGSGSAGAVEIGEIFASEALGVFAEAFELPITLSATLISSSTEAPIHLAGFPVAPGVRAAVILEPFEVYAPGARVLVVDAAGEREILRSPHLHFLGNVEGDFATRIGLSVDPQTGGITGLISGSSGEIQLLPPKASASRHRLERSDAMLAIHGINLDTDCATDEMPLPDTLDDLLVRAPDGVGGNRGSVPTHSATIAVDTDAELLDKKFSNNTTTAGNYVADLITQMNVAYERDVGLTLLLGDTILRTGSPPYDNDPYDVAGSPASSAHLNEFGGFWASTMGGVDRVLAMLLSGKSSSNNSASGIAWVDGYCEFQSSGGGYSVNQVFLASFSSATLVAHELGHNFGSPHTHCYSPPVDECYRAQPGCYAGAVSCPGGPGTTMSYCNFGAPNGAACGQNRLEFHPTVVSLFDSFIANHAPGCINVLGTAEIFADGFEDGDTRNWL